MIIKYIIFSYTCNDFLHAACSFDKILFALNRIVYHKTPIALPETANEFVEKYEGLIQTVINVYRSKYIIAADMKDELIQEVRLFLILRHKVIVKQYKGTASFETYLSSIIMRRINHVMRAERRAHGDGHKKMNYHEPSYNDHAVYSVFINEEIELLENAMAFLKEEYPKFRFLQKLYGRMSFKEVDIEEYCKDYKSHPYKTILKEAQKLKPNKEKLNEGITAFINSHEGKQNGPHAARMWHSHRMNEIIAKLNRTDSGTTHDKQTFNLLFELMEKRKNKSSK